MKLLLFTIILVLSTMSCGVKTKEANASGGIFIQTVSAPDGATCYVIIQGNDAKGGNCR